MPRLAIRLLGRYEASLDEKLLAGFDSDKVRALLAYLAVEGERPQRREKLAGLLWPDYPEASARTSLRRALSNLRDVINDRDVDPPFLKITRQTIQFNTESNSSIDTTLFLNLVEGETGQIEEAVDLYQGEFLEGFSVPDSIAFEEWLITTRESLQSQALAALQKLIRYYEELESYGQALQFARMAIEIEPYDEAAHRAIMRSLAGSGQQAQALSQYEDLKKTLRVDFGADPSPETSTLAEAISAGSFRADQPGAGMLRGYKLLDLLGEGHFGAVYRAHQKAVGRDVAIKVVLPEYADDPNFIRRFESEAQLVARLEHPYIVPLYDYWREPGGAYLVMRWLRGGSLKAALDRGPWSGEAAVRLIDQVSSALAAAHQQGVVHRDIKPENILLDEAGNAYLSDFGIATLTGPLTTLMSNAAAEDLQTASSMSYLSPELAAGGDPAPTADIYSLGVTIFELLTGVPPFPDLEGEALRKAHRSQPIPSIAESRSDLPPGVGEVIQKATAKDPDDRYQSAHDLALDLQAVITGTAAPAGEARLAEISNPYKGLQAFQETDADDFYGRERMVARLLDRLSPSPSQGEGRGGGITSFLALVGPSGSGKSSLVKAGLLPALRRGALDGSDKWFVSEMTPGARPFEELEAAILRVAINPPDQLLHQLREDERGLVRAVKRALPADQETELLLVVDQFEELFTLAEPAMARDFLDAIYAAVMDQESRLRVVITLRADFFDRPLMVPNFSELIRTRTEAITPLSAEELASAVEEPARKSGVVFDEGLAARLVAEVHDQTGALPLLQYALTELFDRREGAMLTSTAYDAMGGVSGALGRTAEEIYQQLNPDGREMARQVFLRLVTLGEGVEDTRRRVLRSELESLTDRENTPAVSSLLDLYGKHRLLTFDRDAESRAPTVEVAHEALLREWRRFEEWLDESRADVRLQRVLGNLAADWEQSGRDPSFLLHGARLDQYEAWAAETNLALTEEEQAYLKSSLAERRQREAHEAARLEHERALEQRSIRRLRIIVGVLIVASVLGVILTLAVINQNTLANRNAELANQNAATATVAQGDALNKAATATVAQGEAQIQAATAEAERQRAETEAEARATQQAIAEFERDQARSLALAASAELARAAGDTELALALALEANQVNSPPVQAQLALAEAAYAPGTAGVLDGHAINQVYSISISPDDSQAISGAVDRSVIRWDMETGEPLQRYGGYRGSVASVDYLPDGDHALLGVADGSLRVLDLESGEELQRLFPRQPFVPAAFSPNVRTAAWITDTGRLTLLDLENHESILEFDFEPAEDLANTVSVLAFSPDGAFVLSGHADGEVHAWDPSSSAAVRSYRGPAAAVEDLAMSGNAQVILGANANGGVVAWDFLTAEPLWRYTPQAIDDQVYRLAVLPDTQGVVFAAADGGLRVVDLQTGEETGRMGGPGSKEGHLSWITSLVVTPDGQKAVSGGSDGELILWDLKTGAEIRRFGGRPDERFLSAVLSLDLSQDGSQILAGHEDGDVIVWDIETGEQAESLGSGFLNVESLTFRPDGQTVWTSTIDGAINLWDPGEEDYQPLMFGAPVGWMEAVVSPDGRQAVSIISLIFPLLGAEDIWVWDLERGKVIQRLEGEAGPHQTEVSISPDGTRALAGNSAGKVVLWDLERGEILQTLDGHQGENILDVGFSPDGSQALTSAVDEGLLLWDLASGAMLHEFPIVLNAERHVFSPDGSAIIAGLSTGNIQIWDAETFEEIARYTSGHTDVVLSLAVSSDGATAASSAINRSARRWDFNRGIEAGRLDWPGFQFGVAISPDGTRVLTGVGSDLLYWNIETGQVLNQLISGSDPPIFDLVFTPDGRRALASFGHPFLNDPTGLALWDLESGELLQRLDAEGQFFLIDVTRDGKYGVISSVTFSGFPAVFLWDFETGAVLDRFQLGPETVNIADVAVSPDGKRVLTGRLEQIEADFLVEEWDLETGERLQTLIGHENSVIDLAYLPDGEHAVTVSWDNSLILWDLEEGEIKLRMQGDNPELFSVDVDPTGRYAIVGGGDGSLILWDLETGEAIRKFTGHEGPVTHVVFSPDGDLAYTTAFDGTARIWHIHRTREELVDWIEENRYIRELTCEERDLYQVEPLCE